MPAPADKLDTNEVNGPQDDDLDWDAIYWRPDEEDARRLRTRPTPPPTTPTTRSRRAGIRSSLLLALLDVADGRRRTEHARPGPARRARRGVAPPG